MARRPLDRMPGYYNALALLVGARRLVHREWNGTPAHRWGLGRPRPEGLSADPLDYRPADPETGRHIAAGAFVMGGDSMGVGKRGDPWNRASPSRRFAVALHRFGWLRHLIAADGADEGLRLLLEWSRAFGRWNAFSWSGEVLERRVFNLACCARALCGRASEAETAQVADDLARQARALLEVEDDPAREAERAAVAAIAGCALAGVAGERLRERALARLVDLLPDTVLADGGHASRRPEAAVELLYDLRTLDDALGQLGVLAPAELSRAIDRLAGAVRFFTLDDGRLAVFQGGEALSPSYVAAARPRPAADAPATPPPTPESRNGYHRLVAGRLLAVADAHAPARGALSVTACAQPMALEILVGGRRLIGGCGWSPRAQAPQAVRLIDGASCVSLGEAACGEPLQGFAARTLGPRLRDAWPTIEARRQDAAGKAWLEIVHDGWVERFGLSHERRLFADGEGEELRGEDAFVPVSPPDGQDGRRFIPYILRFHLHPGVSALAARDGRSVLIKAEGDETGWALRCDAQDVGVEGSVHYVDGHARRCQQIVLRGQVRLDTGGKVRWKLSPAVQRVDAGAAGA